MEDDFFKYYYFVIPLFVAIESIVQLLQLLQTKLNNGQKKDCSKHNPACLSLSKARQTWLRICTSVHLVVEAVRLIVGVA